MRLIMFSLSTDKGATAPSQLVFALVILVRLIIRLTAFAFVLGLLAVDDAVGASVVHSMSPFSLRYPFSIRARACRP